MFWGSLTHFAAQVTQGCVAALNTDTEMQDYGRIIDGPADPAWRSIFKAIPLICFSFFCHATFPMVYDSLKDTSLARMDRVSAATMLMCFVM